MPSFTGEFRHGTVVRIRKHSWSLGYIIFPFDIEDFVMKRNGAMLFLFLFAFSAKLLHGQGLAPRAACSSRSNAMVFRSDGFSMKVPADWQFIQRFGLLGPVGNVERRADGSEN